MVWRNLEDGIIELIFLIFNSSHIDFSVSIEKQIRVHVLIFYKQKRRKKVGVCSANTCEEKKLSFEEEGLANGVPGREGKADKGSWEVTTIPQENRALWQIQEKHKWLFREKKK